MTYYDLRNSAMLQGNVKLVLWDGNGDIAREDQIICTSNANIFNSDFWDNLKIKYIFATDDGFLQIDFDEE